MARPIEIRMGGYGPATTGFSRALKRIGDRLAGKFCDRVDIKYVWNIMDLGYRAEDILWLVEHGLLTLGYQSSSYLTDRVPELGFVDLPFLFARTEDARAAIDGALGQFLARKIESQVNYRILGFFENGFRHLSNRLRAVHRPADLAGLRIRVLPSQVQARSRQGGDRLPARSARARGGGRAGSDRSGGLRGDGARRGRARGVRRGGAAALARRAPAVRRGVVRPRRSSVKGHGPPEITERIQAS
jgi:hypothetical protein